MENINMILGANILKYRKKSGLSQEQLAEKVGVSLEYISEIERGLKMPSRQLFLKLIEILGASADYLLMGVASTSIFDEENHIARKLEKLTPKQRIVIEAIIDTYIEYLDYWEPKV